MAVSRSLAQQVPLHEEHRGVELEIRVFLLGESHGFHRWPPDTTRELPVSSRAATIWSASLLGTRGSFAPATTIIGLVMLHGVAEARSDQHLATQGMPTPHGGRTVVGIAVGLLRDAGQHRGNVLQHEVLIGRDGGVLGLRSLGCGGKRTFLQRR